MSQKRNSSLSTKFRRIARHASANLPVDLPPVFYCTDEDRDFNNIGIVSNLPRGWGVIFRTRNIEQSIKEAIALRQVCLRRGVRFLMAQSPMVAQEIGADGVHWPEVRIRDTRYWRGRFPIATASVHSYKGVRNAEKLPIDAVLFSSVFASDSLSSQPPMGPIQYRTIVRSTRIPIYALAGVTAGNAHSVASVGGIASVSGVAEVFQKL